MFWLVATIILGIVGVVAVFVASSDKQYRAQGLGVAGACLVLWLILSFFNSIHTVGQRQVGIVYNFAGTITGRKDPGVVFTMPWQHIKRENVGIQREDFQLDESNAAVSQDQQPIFAHLTINFHVESGSVVDLYKRVGPQWKKILLDSRALQDFKEVTAQYTAQQITTQRQALRKDTKDRLTAELTPYDVHVDDVFVANLGYTQSYKNAINAKNVQVQQSLQAEAKVAQAKAEGDQQLALARKQAEANRLLSKSITPNIIRLKSIEKLNPNVQVIYVPQGASLFLPQATATK